MSPPPPGPLIGASALARLLARPDQPDPSRRSGRPVVLDVRWRLAGPPGIDSYRAGHIPGAVFADLDTDLAGPPGGAGGRHPLPDRMRFTDAMRRVGLHDGQLVVVYDDGDAGPASRAWWTLRYYGHSQVRVLDGGYRAWSAAGLPVSVAPSTPAPGGFTAVPGGMPVLDAAGAAALARTGVLLDARAPERYRGETEPVDPVPGHIPGAVSAPSAANLGKRGRFRPKADLAARYAGLGAGDGRPVGVYCGSGVTACTDVLALAVTGIEAALYPGSWSGWLADPGHPVATGPDPG
jgi:thiosulfate/3-mercaptopyruvate sulfurtransferase